MKTSISPIAVTCLLLALAGCDVPRDPEQTLDHVRGATLVVGIGTGDDLTDPRERAAVDRLADELDARTVFRRAEFHRLATELENGEIDMIAGALPENTPFSKRLGLSAPVSSVRLGEREIKTVFAVRKGENGFLKSVETAIGQTR